MRITNGMTTNRMLLNINRNATLVDTLYSQLTSGKKIQLPSDDPIIASRALKFRTNISETMQFKRNTSQGLSWMDTTEQAFKNTTSILESIRGLSVQGSNDPLEASDRQKITAEIKLLYDQITAEMNISYAGRYVFSGYRTDVPPTFESDQSSAHYRINQQFTIHDFDKTKIAQKVSTTDAPEVYEPNRLLLPYNQIDGVSKPSIAINEYDPKGNYVGALMAPVQVTNVYKSDNPLAYKPAAGEINLIQDTGELIFADDALANIQTLYGGTTPPNTAKIEVTYEKKGFSKGELNPLVYYSCLDLNTNIAYDMRNQDMQYEFGTNTRIKINTLAKDVLMPQLYADLKFLCAELDKVSFSNEKDLMDKYLNMSLSEAEAKEAVKEQIKEETQKFTGVLHAQFSSMLKKIDTHNASLSTEYTNLGSRMNRLKLIESRLEEDRVNYTSLMNDNENVDYLEAIMQMTSAQSIYQAAMKAGGMITQISLVDFIR